MDKFVKSETSRRCPSFGTVLLLPALPSLLPPRTPGNRRSYKPLTVEAPYSQGSLSCWKSSLKSSPGRPTATTLPTSTTIN